MYTVRVEPRQAPTMPQAAPLRVVLDSDAVDHLAAPGAYEHVRIAVRDGRLQLLVTHIVHREKGNTPDTEQRARNQALL